jgi:spermidine/putrescine transport system ATP-binding protein
LDIPAVEARAVTKAFGEGPDKVLALDDVSVEIRQNEFFTLLGPSGCGKTTLLRLIAGFDHPTSGSILLNGKDISSLPPYKRPVNTVFQSYALFPHMSVSGNIGFGLEMLGKPKSEVARTVDEMLRLVQMEALKNRQTAQISGGQQQRVALARALAPHPEVLLLDEPLSALDLKLRKEMQIELKRLQHETGITFVFVTHDQEEALTMSDRIAVMSNGRILQIGSPREIYDQPSVRFVADFIGDINFLEAKATAANGALTADIAGVGTLDIGDKAGIAAGEALTLAIRPERIELSKAAAGSLPGRLTNIVYHGTDTIFHFTLPDGAAMRARSQNREGFETDFKVGDEVGWRAGPASVAVIRDGGA